MTPAPQEPLPKALLLGPTPPHQESIAMRNRLLERPTPRVRGLFVAAALLVQAAAHGQEGVLRFDHLSVEDGLSHSRVTSIVQDRLGFIWLATQEGLSRYDGYGFKVYRHDPDDPGSLADSEAEALLLDRQGELWVGTFGGLDRFVQAEERFEHHRHDPSDPGSLSHDIVQAE